MGEIGDYYRDLTEAIRAERSKRMEDFLNRVVTKLLSSKEVTSIEKHVTYVTVHTTSYGTIDVYPKSNRLLVRKSNTWYDGATRWLELKVINKSKYE